MTKYKDGDKVVIIAQDNDDYTMGAVIGSVAEIKTPLRRGVYGVLYLTNIGGQCIGYIKPSSIKPYEGDDELASEIPTQGGVIVERRVKVVSAKEQRKALVAEQDYELATLFDALSTQDEKGIERSKERLSEIHTELEAL